MEKTPNVHYFFKQLQYSTFLLLMEELVYGPCRFLIHPVYFPQLFHRCLPDFLQRLELTHQCFSPGLADIRDIIQHRMNRLFAAQGTMILDSKPMCLILIRVISRNPSECRSMGISSLLKYNPLVL